ncbi:TasA family protein [Sinomonas mesophila]|uniref:TasA family protein n=1 Tax=Sinomonas mesophila TaxID=1531955 RepID=UPI0009853B00|nr:TasA family protein [Sinomonas mesophila]
MGIRLNSTSGKILASAALIGAAASVAGLGTYGAFTSTTSASETVSSGTVVIGLGASGTAANRLDVAATGIVPGDSVQRAVTLTNSGNQDLSAVTLTTTATTSSILDTDGASGLQVTIDRCSVAWTEADAPSGGYTYTCSGTTSSVLASRAIIGANVALSNLAAVGLGQTDNLRVTVSLPAAANNDFQGKSSTVQFAFTGTQRTATSK